MSAKEKFSGFRYQDNEKYKQAAIDMYGKEVIEEAIEKQKGKEQEIADGFNEIFFAFSENKLYSTIFDSATTDEEHAKIIEDYKKNASKVLKEKLNVKEQKGALLLYNSKKLIKI